MNTTYDVNSLVSKLKQYVGKSVILQFPNQEVNLAVKVQQQLQIELPDVEFFILSDHLKPDCCVDLVGAQHVYYDLVVHFGECCFTTDNKQVIYVLPQSDFDTEKFKELIDIEEYKGSFLLTQQKFQVMCDRLDFQNGIHLLTVFPKEGMQRIALGYYCDIQIQPESLIYLGKEDDSLFINFIQQFGYFFKRTLVVDPQSMQLQQINLNLNSQIIKRTALIKKAQNCQCFGLIVNNPSASFARETLSKCQNLIIQNKLRYFNFSMNNLTEAKLGNFPEIDCYVIISCHNTAIIDEKKFYKLVITPFDLQCALDPDFSYIGKIQTDLNKLDVIIDNIQLKEIEEQRQLMLNKGELLPLNEMFQTLDHYQSRTYQGINQDQQKPPSILKQGMIGIATNYKQL